MLFYLTSRKQPLQPKRTTHLSKTLTETQLLWTCNVRIYAEKYLIIHLNGAITFIFGVNVELRSTTQSTDIRTKAAPSKSGCGIKKNFTETVTVV